MKNNVAYIIQEMADITGHPPVKKALQKTVFLIEKKGINLDFDYMLHFYGPYCAELDHETAVLSANGVIDFVYSQYGHKMNVSEECGEVLSEDLAECQTDTIKEVIQHYRNSTASQLELLTTAIYAYDHTGAKTRADVTSNVKKIKGEKYSDTEIEWALNEFSYFGLAFE